MAARITKYVNKYVRRGLCLIYISLPPDIGFTLFTPVRESVEWGKGVVYKGEPITKNLRYNTCMSSYPEDRKWTNIEP
jgi:hypothetical protein